MVALFAFKTNLAPNARRTSEWADGAKFWRRLRKEHRAACGREPNGGAAAQGPMALFLQARSLRELSGYALSEWSFVLLLSLSSRRKQKQLGRFE